LLNPGIYPNQGCEPSRFGRGQRWRLVGDLCSQRAGTQKMGEERRQPEVVHQRPIDELVLCSAAATTDDLVHEGRLLLWGIPATGVLVETLLDRGDDDDVSEAESAIERLAEAPADEGLVIRDIWLLRLRALLARAHGDAAAYADFPDRYRAMATSMGLEGHMKWAEAMP
jgi:hypothetical protein